MNRRHIQTGLLFVAVCIIIGLGLALLTMSRGSTDTGNGTAMIANTTALVDNTVDAADVKQTPTDFLVTDELRRHPPTWENVGEGPTGTVFCATDKAHITNGSSRRLNLKVVVKDGDETIPLGSLAAGQTLAFDAGNPAEWIIADADNDAALFEYEVNDCAHPAVDATATAAPTADTQGPKRGRCRLSVNGQSFLDGQCYYAMREDGSFSISDATGRTRLAAFLEITDGTASARWTGAQGGDKVDQPLGSMTQNGPCWRSDHAELCLWPG